MSATYTGNPAAVTARQATVVTNPVDGDGLSAGSNSPAPDTLADQVAFLMQYAALLSPAALGMTPNAGILDLQGLADQLLPSAWYSGTPAVRKLIHQFNTTGLTKAVRMYAEGVGSTNGAGGLIITMNAGWSVASGGRWFNDDPSHEAWGFYLGRTMFVVRVDAATAHTGITDAAFWAATATPATSDPIKNEVLPVLCAKAYGCVRSSNGAGSVISGINIASVTVPAPGEIRVTFAQPMADAGYAVIPALMSSPGASGALPAPAITARTTTYFQVAVFSSISGTGGARVDLTGGSSGVWDVMFHVFGNQ